MGNLGDIYLYMSPNGQFWKKEIIIDNYKAFFILHVISTLDIHIRTRDEVSRSNMGRGLTVNKSIRTIPIFPISRCTFITTPFRLNRHSCLLSESGNGTFQSYVQTICISNWLIWKQKVCKTFLSSSRNISIIIVTQNSLKMFSWPIFWTKSVTL